VCTHIERCLQLKDGVIQVAYEVLWKKTGEDNQKVGNISQVVSQVPTLGPEHEKTRTW